ncbi:MAG: hypothetical protein JW902_01100 [Syntrophaceae bacterium]|nr:hypothetical protein [Syntrophaceae bacterium]
MTTDSVSGLGRGGKTQKDRKDQLPFSPGRRYSLPLPCSDKLSYVDWHCTILTMRGILTEDRGDQHGFLPHPFVLKAHQYLLQGSLAAAAAQKISDSGSDTAGTKGGGRIGRPRQARIFAMASGESMAAMIRILSPQRGQRSTSSSKTRHKSSPGVVSPFFPLIRGWQQELMVEQGKRSRLTPTRRPKRDSIRNRKQWIGMVESKSSITREERLVKRE